MSTKKFKIKLKPHEKVLHGLCVVCGHYGDDCEGTNKPAHTPTPLKVDLNVSLTDADGFAFDAQEIVADDGAITIGYIIDKEHAVFIVRAVNAHEELLQNLKNIEASFTRRCFRTGCNAAEELMLKSVRQTIAKAEARHD